MADILPKVGRKPRFGSLNKFIKSAVGATAASAASMFLKSLADIIDNLHMIFDRDIIHILSSPDHRCYSTKSFGSSSRCSMEEDLPSHC